MYVYDRETHSVERISVGVTHGSTLTALQSDFVVNGVTTGDQNQAAITATADGGFIATYTTTDGSGTGIHAATYDHFGNKVSNFNVNSNTVGDQSQSAVTSLADGRVVVVWTTADGNRRDPRTDFRFDRHGWWRDRHQQRRDGRAEQSGNSALANGGFVATWQSAGGANGTEISARVFKADERRKPISSRSTPMRRWIRAMPKPRRCPPAASSLFGSRRERTAAG